MVRVRMIVVTPIGLGALTPQGNLGAARTRRAFWVSPADARGGEVVFGTGARASTTSTHAAHTLCVEVLGLSDASPLLG